MGELIDILNTEWNEPQLYGIYHILSLVTTVLVTFLLCFFIKAPTEKNIRKILLITSLTVMVLEIYKQISFSFTHENGKIIFDYQWYAFPFQFCSTPMYVGLLASLIKNEKIHKCLCAYLSTFALFAGTAVMIFPETVFVKTIGINIQTVVCHGSMIVIGIYLLYSGYIKAEHKTLFKAIPVFAVMLTCACILNEIANLSGLLATEDFNMFFISPYGTPSLPLFSLIQPHLPFVLDLVVYIIGFSLASYVMLLIAMLVKSLSQKFSSKKKLSLN